MFVPHQSIWPATRSLDRQFELAVLPPILQQVTMSANIRTGGSPEMPMSVDGTKREFSPERLEGRKPPHCRRLGVYVGLSAHF